MSSSKKRYLNFKVSTLLGNGKDEWDAAQYLQFSFVLVPGYLCSTQSLSFQAEAWLKDKFLGGKGRKSRDYCGGGEDCLRCYRTAKFICICSASLFQLLVSDMPRALGSLFHGDSFMQFCLVCAWSSSVVVMDAGTLDAVRH
jgi:hypothetical protein